MAALIRGHDQTHDLARATNFQDVLLGRMDPANDAALRRLRHEHDVLRPE
jgi:hypothetical protein